MAVPSPALCCLTAAALLTSMPWLWGLLGSSGQVPAHVGLAGKHGLKPQREKRRGRREGRGCRARERHSCADSQPPLPGWAPPLMQENATLCVQPAGNRCWIPFPARAEGLGVPWEHLGCPPDPTGPAGSTGGAPTAGGWLLSSQPCLQAWGRGVGLALPSLGGIKEAAHPCLDCASFGHHCPSPREHFRMLLASPAHVTFCFPHEGNVSRAGNGNNTLCLLWADPSSTNPQPPRVIHVLLTDLGTHCFSSQEWSSSSFLCKASLLFGARTKLSGEPWHGNRCCFHP